MRVTADEEMRVVFVGQEFRVATNSRAVESNVRHDDAHLVVVIVVELYRHGLWPSVFAIDVAANCQGLCQVFKWSEHLGISDVAGMQN